MDNAGARDGSHGENTNLRERNLLLLRCVHVEVCVYVDTPRDRMHGHQVLFLLCNKCKISLNSIRQRGKFRTRFKNNLIKIECFFTSQFHKLLIKSGGNSGPYQRMKMWYNPGFLGCRKLPKEFHLDYDKLEDRPSLQTSLSGSGPSPGPSGRMSSILYSKVES